MNRLPEVGGSNLPAGILFKAIALRKSTLAMLAMIVLAFALGALLYPRMPEQMASHWNAAGEVGGYLPKFWGLFLMPLISLAFVGLFLLIPRIDPLKKNIAKFRDYFDNFVVLITAFLFYLYVISLAWNLGQRFQIIQLLAPAFAVVFYYAGVLCSKAKRNWFIGIRTPWTLSNEVVWEKTHERGAKLFKASGVITFFGALFPEYAIILVLAPVIGSVVYAIVFSYFEYQKQENVEEKIKGSKRVKRKRE